MRPVIMKTPKRERTATRKPKRRESGLTRELPEFVEVDEAEGDVDDAVCETDVAEDMGCKEFGMMGTSEGVPLKELDI